MAKKVSVQNYSLRAFGIGGRLGNMEEKVSHKPYSFIGFWILAIWEGTKKSFKGFGKAVEIGAIGLAFGLLGVRWYSRNHTGFNTGNGEEFVNFWVAVSPLAIGAAWFLFHIFWHPYKSNKEKWERNAVEIHKRDAKIVELTAEIHSLKNPVWKPLEIEILPPKRLSNTDWLYLCEATVHNPNHGLDGVKFRLIDIFPPMMGGEKRSDLCDLDYIKFQLDGSPASILTGNQ